MRCPFCSHLDSRVVDSRPTDEGNAIRRRRECAACSRRFTTYEKIEELPMMVSKKDGRREAFDRSKILAGLFKACEKRPVSAAVLEQIANDIEQHLRNQLCPEVESEQIGEMVMDRLRAVDEVAYVRFASVYRQFTDILQLKQELDRLLGQKHD